ncbi:hypothetical protein NW768_007374 [Fusarium equiseti]|uniref:CCHC-type domain-containing protein n=1 Tax=Fusarium equiseti TaxID=61235 RepID=A0ABQ8R7T1_FUSEQ|nr:hypothetical protein NW768_007374 [Fusarium equiseti]
MREDHSKVSICPTSLALAPPENSPQFTTPRSPSPEILSSDSSSFVSQSPEALSPDPQAFFNSLLRPSRLASAGEQSLSVELSQLNLTSKQPGTEFIMTTNGSEITFAGKPGDCKPRVYIAYIKKKIQRENPDLLDKDDEELELKDEFLRQAFQRGLTGPALYWYEEERLSEKPFEEIALQFQEKYKNNSAQHDSTLIAEAHQLGRAPGETLQDFIQRVQSLYHRIPPTYRSVLLTNAIHRMTDAHRDQRLQERIQDRLFAAELWNDGNASPSLTFDRLHRMIWDCRSSSDEVLKQPGAEEHSSLRQGLELNQLEKTENLLSRLAEAQLKFTETLAERQNKERNTTAEKQSGNRWNGNSTQNTANTWQNNSYNSGRNGTRDGNIGGQVDPRDKRFWWCFNCTEWGHKSSDCPINENRERKMANANYFREHQEKLMGDRARTLQTEPAAAIKSVLSFKSPRPPAGFTTTPVSHIAPGNEGTPRSPVRPDANFVQPWRPETNLSEPWRPEVSIAQPWRPMTEPWRPREVRAAMPPTSKPQQKNPPPSGVRKNQRGNKDNVMDNEKLRALADAAASHPEWVRRAPVQNNPPSPPGPRVVELEKDDELPPQNSDDMDADSVDEISAAEFAKLWPRLKPHVEKQMAQDQQNESGKASSDAVKKPRYLLDKIRATEQYDIPNFEIGRHLKDTPITLSVLELLQIAPSIRQQLSRLMQCRRKLKGTRHEEKLVNVLAPFRTILESELGDDVDESALSTEMSSCNLIRDAESGRLDVRPGSGLPEEAVATTLGYITGHLGGFRTEVILLDGGSGVNLVNSSFLFDNGLRPLNLSEKEPIRLANDDVVYIEQFALLELVVGNVLTVITVYLIDGNSDWDLLVGRPWLRRVRAVEHYAEEKLVVRGINGGRSVLDITPCPKRYQPIRQKGETRPAYRQDWSEKLAEEEVVHVENDDEILQEVEDILAELHGTIQGTSGRVDGAGN